MDSLLGIADCGRCSRGPPCHSTDGATIANNTLFAWTLGGAIPDVSLPTSILRVQGKETPLDSLLQSMWTLDQSPDVSTKHLSQDDKLLLIFTIRYFTRRQICCSFALSC